MWYDRRRWLEGFLSGRFEESPKGEPSFSLFRMGREVMWVLRFVRWRAWRCVNLTDVVTLHVPIDGPRDTSVCKSVVPSTDCPSLPVTFRLVVLWWKKKRVNLEERVRNGWMCTDYDSFMKHFGRSLVGLEFLGPVFWRRTTVQWWVFRGSVETVEEEEGVRRERSGINERRLFTRLVPAGCGPSSRSRPRRRAPTDRGFPGLQQRACSSSPPRRTRSSRTM